MKPPFAASADVHTPGGGETIFPHHSFSLCVSRGKEEGLFVWFAHITNIYMHTYTCTYIYICINVHEYIFL